MSVLINADTSDGLKFTSDTSGEIKLQSAGTDIATVDSSGITMASGKAVDVATALSTASGSAPSYSARAWVQFDGTGTVSIYGNGNVSSITDNGVGDYTLNFTTAMEDTNYSVCGSCVGQTTAGGKTTIYGSSGSSGKTVNDFDFNIGNISGTDLDVDNVSVIVFR